MATWTIPPTTVSCYPSLSGRRPKTPNQPGDPGSAHCSNRGSSNNPRSQFLLRLNHTHTLTLTHNPNPHTVTHANSPNVAVDETGGGAGSVAGNRFDDGRRGRQTSESGEPGGVSPRTF